MGETVGCVRLRFLKYAIADQEYFPGSVSMVPKPVAHRLLNSGIAVLEPEEKQETAAVRHDKTAKPRFRNTSKEYR